MKKVVVIILFIIIAFGSGVQAIEEQNSENSEVTESSSSSPNQETVQETITETVVEEAHEDSVHTTASSVAESISESETTEDSQSVGVEVSSSIGQGTGTVIASVTDQSTDGTLSAAAAETAALPKGTEEDPVRESISTTEATAKGENIHIVSTAYAQGTKVKGDGFAGLNGIGKGLVQISTIILSNGFYGITVIAEVDGSGEGLTRAWAEAWADIFSESSSTNPNANNNPITIGAVPSSIGGYIFGHSDAERYYHFKKQAILNCYDGVNETGFKTCQRAVYNMEVLLDRNGDNQTNFEYKYNLTEVIRIRDLLINMSKS